MRSVRLLLHHLVAKVPNIVIIIMSNCTVVWYILLGNNDHSISKFRIAIQEGSDKVQL